MIKFFLLVILASLIFKALHLREVSVRGEAHRGNAQYSRKEMLD
jgi:hypothetical protein